MTRKNSCSSMPEKVCLKCGASKPINEFGKHHETADGHRNNCKECAAKAERERRCGPAHQGILEYDRARRKTPERKAMAARAWQKQYRKSPERWAVIMAIQRARRGGTLIAPDACPACGVTGKMHAHHNDYSKPLDVEWLCDHCHRTLRHGTYVTP